MMLDQDTSTNSELKVSPEVKNFLWETARWAKFMSVLGLLFIALLVLTGFTMSSLSKMAKPEDFNLPMPFEQLSFVYIAVALIFVPIVWNHYQFASKMQIALQYNQQEILHLAFNNLRLYYRFSGVLIIIGIIAYFAFLFFYLSKMKG